MTVYAKEKAYSTCLDIIEKGYGWARGELSLTNDELDTLRTIADPIFGYEKLRSDEVAKVDCPVWQKLARLGFVMLETQDQRKEGSKVYTDINFPTKKAFREAVKAGRKVRLYAPGLGTPVRNGTEAVEGPHYPGPHTWYAIVEVRDGIVVKVKQGGRYEDRQDDKSP